MLGPLATRPHLAGSIGLGLVVGAALLLIPNDLRWSTKAIFAWDAVWAAFVGTMLHAMMRSDVEKIKTRAATQDEGQGAILTLALVAAAASIAAVAGELSLAKADHGLVKGLRVALAFVTVAGSWLFVQLIFALHYAHEYYQPDDDPATNDPRGGLGFPGDEDPDYWDFLHFSAVIGVASQTADITFTAKGLRRTGTLHSVIAFTFNTVVLALTINLLAGLF
ncbi:MAG: DUF1345 domain-containing protein [Caulobacteraceae bacterium]